MMKDFDNDPRYHLDEYSTSDHAVPPKFTVGEWVVFIALLIIGAVCLVASYLGSESLLQFYSHAH